MGPPVAPTITLANLPSTIASGGPQVHVCGTVTNIPDGATIDIMVINYWFDPLLPPCFSNHYVLFDNPTVTGGAFGL